MEFIIFAIAIGAFVLSLFFPKIVLFVTVAVMPFYKVMGAITISEAEISAFDGLIMVLFIISIIRLPLLLRRSEPILFDLIVIIWVLLNMMPFLFYRTDFIYGLNTFRNFVAIPVALYFILRLYITDMNTLGRLLWTINITTFIMALLGIVEFSHTHQRIRSVIEAGHAGSILMAIGTFSGIYLLQCAKRNFIRKFLIFSICINFIGVVLVFGRVMIPAIILVPLLVAFFLKRRQATILIFTVCLLVTGFVSPLKVIIYDEGAKAYEQQIRKGSNLKGVARISDIDQMEAALGVRTIPYLISINYIKNRPIFGYGYSIHKQLKEKEGFLLAHSHNIGLDILLRTGFLGLFTFIAVILFFVKGAVNRVKEINSQQKTAVMLFLSLVYIIIINGFANSIANLATSCALWLCMGLVISAQNMTTFRQNGLKF